MRRLLFAVVLATALAGCQTPSTTEVGAPIEDKSGAAAASGATTSGAGADRVTGVTTGSGATGGVPAELRDPNSILSKRSVYFEYDSFVVREEFKPMIEAHAKYLQRNRSAKMTLQGHTDERGSPEYNIALGQKRADAVKRMLVLLGATEMQVETVSFGKEKPKNAGHDEAAWSENRRVDILYAGE
jgi:peptidoglycan-associated lipoprotein